MSSEYVPCKFCGNGLELEIDRDYTTGFIFVSCSCGARGPNGEDVDSAVNGWNSCESGLVDALSDVLRPAIEAARGRTKTYTIQSVKKWDEHEALLEAGRILGVE